MIYLYVKTHNKTGLKYLGKTKSADPHRYPGSGKVWRRHLKKYGYDYTTEIIFQTECEKEFAKKAEYYSQVFGVDESKYWANLMPERGDGGDTSAFFDEVVRKKQSEGAIRGNKSRSLSEKTREKQRQANLGRDYGKIWITDGRDSKMWPRDEKIPDGWARGRTVKRDLKGMFL